MFILGSDVWIPNGRGIFKFWSDWHAIGSFYYVRFEWSEVSFDHTYKSTTFEVLEAMPVI